MLPVSWAGGAGRGERSPLGAPAAPVCRGGPIRSPTDRPDAPLHGEDDLRSGIGGPLCVPRNDSGTTGRCVTSAASSVMNAVSIVSITDPLVRPGEPSSRAGVL